MLLKNFNFMRLAMALEPHMGEPAWPGFDARKGRLKVRKLAQRSAMWKRLASVNASDPISVLRYSLFREFKRTGNRTGYQNPYSALQSRTMSAVLAVWLDHPDANLDHAQDLLWHWCEMHTWAMPAHERPGAHLRRTIELGSTHVGIMLSEALYMLGGQLDPEVADRLATEIDQRLLVPTHDYRDIHWWATCGTNWNLVCNANLITIALYRISSPDQLAKFIHPLIERLEYALCGFAKDGGCLEGPSYWEYGFGHFVQAALVIHHRTGGKVNLMDDPRIEQICRYPIATYLKPPLRTCFADAEHGYISTLTALMINRFYNIPELFALTAPAPGGKLEMNNYR